MKRFTSFISEAQMSQAAEQARKLGLKSDGHGNWIDRQGKVTARTEGGKLQFIDKKGPKAAEDPKAERKPSGVAAPAPAQKAAAPAPQQQKQAAPEEEGGGEEERILTVVFGRFNPPTVGHEKLLKSAKQVSAGGDIKIYPSRSQDPKKNPLDPDMKASFMKKMFPDFKDNIINDPDMKTIFDVLVRAEEDGYNSVTIVVGSDRQAEFENLATKYNGELYNFENIRVVSAGVRDADAEGVEGMSASKMRKAVADDDFKAFRMGTPKALSDAETQSLFDATRQGMKLKKTKKEDQKEEWQIAPKLYPQDLRDSYLTGKIYRMGDIVENLNTGLVGKITRRGTNHLICVTEDGIMFKSWIRDVTEALGSEKTRPAGKPNTLVGTPGYTKLAMKMTGTSKIKNFNVEELLNKYMLKK